MRSGRFLGESFFGSEAKERRGDEKEWKEKERRRPSPSRLSIEKKEHKIFSPDSPRHTAHCVSCSISSKRISMVLFSVTKGREREKSDCESESELKIETKGKENTLRPLEGDAKKHHRDSALTCPPSRISRLPQETSGHLLEALARGQAEEKDLRRRRSSGRCLPRGPWLLLSALSLSPSPLPLPLCRHSPPLFRAQNPPCSVSEGARSLFSPEWRVAAPRRDSVAVAAEKD